MTLIEYFRLFTDAWRLFRKYYPEQKSDAQCQTAVDDAEIILERYNDTLFARRLLGLVLEEASKKNSA